MLFNWYPNWELIIAFIVLVHQGVISFSNRRSSACEEITFLVARNTFTDFLQTQRQFISAVSSIICWQPPDFWNCFVWIAFFRRALPAYHSEASDIWKQNICLIQFYFESKHLILTFVDSWIICGELLQQFMGGHSTSRNLLWSAAHWNNTSLS